MTGQRDTPTRAGAAADQSGPVRIVVADDHAIVRSGLRALLEAQPDFAVVGEAEDGEGAWRQACALRPDVLLLDLSMPGVGGAEAAVWIVRDCPEVRVLVLTMHEERSYAARLLGGGAAGYLLKRTAAKELVRAIRVVAAGGRYLDAALNGAASREAPPAPRPGETAAAAADALLDEAEVAVLRLLARGMSNAEVAAALSLDVGEAAARKDTGMAKLGIATRAALVRHAAAAGWTP